MDNPLARAVPQGDWVGIGVRLMAAAVNGVKTI
jgi:hypothetical protein